MLKLFCFILCILGLYAETGVIELNGYIDAEKYASALKTVEQSDSLILSIRSTSADLKSTLDFARKVYTKNIPVTVYINETALGPTAILPFLANKIITTSFVSWGDITLGVENELPSNILFNQVASLLQNKPQLKEIALAMIEKESPNFRDWKLPGQTLVLNYPQLKELGLVEEASENYLTPYVKEVAPEPAANPLSQFIKFNPEGTNVVGRIVIDDRTSGISQATWIYVKEALEFYKKNRPIFIILELNTPGGEVYAAQQISDALKEMDVQEKIPVVAYINNWAISAGAMLAYSSRFIGTVKDGSMGAAEPVLQGEGGKMESASEKVNSAIRTDFANRASFFGRNPYVAEAMVDKDIILVKRHGKIIKLDQENQVRLSGPDPDIVISPKGKLLTLNAQEMIDYGVANFAVGPTKLNPQAPSLLFNEPFLASIPNVEIKPYEMDWKTRFFVFLANPAVSSLLFLGLMIGFYMELSTPGFGLPGTIAAICLGLIILSSFQQEIGGSLELVFLILGLAILLVELFVLPSFGLLGFIGALMFLGGLFALMLPGLSSISYEFDSQTLNAAGEAFFNRLIWLAATLVVGLVIISLLARYVVPKFSGFKRFVLEGYEQTGYIAAEDPKDLPQPGTRGTSLTPLRPSGKIIVEGKVYEAVSSGQFIEQDEPVEVLRLEGSVVVVNIDYKRKE